MPRRTLKVNRLFGGIYRLHLQGWKISWARYLCDIPTCHLISHWYLAQFILHPQTLVDAQQTTSCYIPVPLISHHNIMKNMLLTDSHMSLCLQFHHCQSQSDSQPLSFHAGKPANCFHAGILLGLFFNLEDGGNIFLRNVGWLSMGYMALYLRR
jgi:hypothetical protein